MKEYTPKQLATKTVALVKAILKCQTIDAVGRFVKSAERFYDKEGARYGFDSESFIDFPELIMAAKQAAETAICRQQTESRNAEIKQLEAENLGAEGCYDRELRAMRLAYA